MKCVKDHNQLEQHPSIRIDGHACIAHRGAAGHRSTAPVTKRALKEDSYKINGGSFPLPCLNAQPVQHMQCVLGSVMYGTHRTRISDPYRERKEKRKQRGVWFLPGHTRILPIKLPNCNLRFLHLLSKPNGKDRLHSSG